jgi:hypothetical protein
MNANHEGEKNKTNMAVEEIRVKHGIAKRKRGEFSCFSVRMCQTLRDFIKDVGSEMSYGFEKPRN